jgi:hypothetical protein
MKKILLVTLVVLFAVGIGMAQSYIPTQDVLGAHQNGGRGCAGCHTPHSGARGSGQNTTDPTTGNAALWGQDVSVLYGKTICSGNEGGCSTFSAATTWATPEGSGLLMCLSCHDGQYTPTNMMTNQSYEQKLGLLPKTYGSNPIPTLLGNDGSVIGNYINDHPVGAGTPIDPNDWVGTGVTRTIVPDGRNPGQFVVQTVVAAGSTYDNFLAVYNDNAMLAFKTDGTNIFPVCTTCHNQHSMSVYKAGGRSAPVAGNSTGTYQTFFFVNGPYNPGANTIVGPAGSLTGQAASTTQFCRQCHFGDSNESYGAVRGSIPTVF